MVNGLFYCTPRQSPHFNMAMDEWLFDKLCRGQTDRPAFLRLYSWSEPAITIGYNQNLSRAVDMRFLKDEIAIIRRITGGRAIYHDWSEITFSLICRLDSFPVGGQSLSASNSIVSQLLIETLGRLGVKSSWVRCSHPANLANAEMAQNACFASITKYEITSNGKKIAGIAQRRKGINIIYQGSLKINGASECRAIGQEAIMPADRDGRISYSEADDFGRLAEHMTHVFSSGLGLPFAEEKLNRERASFLEKSALILGRKALEKR
jgi:lipoate-protein ligase A